MSVTLWRHHVIPLLGVFGVFTLTAVLGGALLHFLELDWTFRYLGIPGTALIIISFVYSLRKRKLIKSGSPKGLLAFHEWTATIGSLLIMIHSGRHVHSLLPWFATIAMSVNVISGFVGKLLLKRSKQRVQVEREKLQKKGLSADEIEQRLFWDAVALDAMGQWRKVHIPIFIIFVFLAVGHILSTLVFRSIL